MGAGGRQRNMVGRGYVPDTGDLIWLTFDPQAGREQAGRRPALVLSPAAYNRKSGLAIVCPITSHAKNYPFEVLLPPEMPLSGVILVDHLNIVDWRERRAERAGRVASAVHAEALAKLAPLLGF
jgi:mRNA interferase MazF